MEINLWEHVFTSLYRTVIRVVLALFLSIKASYWPGLAAAGDSGTSRGFTGGVDRGKLFPCNQNCCTWTSNHQDEGKRRTHPYSSNIDQCSWLSFALLWLFKEFQWFHVVHINPYFSGFIHWHRLTGAKESTFKKRVKSTGNKSQQSKRRTNCTHISWGVLHTYTLSSYLYRSVLNQ